jgi:hypothetical protein
MKDTETKQIKVSATIRLALELFKPIHLTFGLPIAEARCEGSPNRVVVAGDSSGKAAEFRYPAVLRLHKPGFQQLRLPTREHRANILHEQVQRPKCLILCPPAVPAEGEVA